jgi:hypothetical protein
VALAVVVAGAVAAVRARRTANRNAAQLLPSANSSIG